FIDRAPQREYTAVKIYDIHKNNKNDNDILNEPIPEYIGNKKLIPNEAYVLVGYYKDDRHLSWIKEKGLYNIRYGNGYILSPSEIGAQYLLLYSKEQTESKLFFKLKHNSAKFCSQSELINILNYKTTPSEKMYLVYELENYCEKEFKDISIDLTKLNVLDVIKKPKAITIEELMKAKIK
ncbi:MAG TPA: hypothetical protein PK029_02815, partial [Bacteroidales bacterium]|nr:hypothetical protein [Bacteroidales bacterium]